MTLIKIFNEHYVGFKSLQRSIPIDPEMEMGADNRKLEEYVLAFLTPYEKNAAGEKRQKTVDNWARGWGSDDKLPSKILKNEMQSGYKLSEEVRRTYWGGGNVVWRVVDPRGFEFEISSSNFAKIIEDVGVLPGGEIPGKCILGRCGAENILIPDGSKYWKQSFKDAEELEKRSKTISTKDVKPGSICTLKSGTNRIYLGHLLLTEYVSELNYSTDQYGHYGSSWSRSYKTYDEFAERKHDINFMQKKPVKYHVYIDQFKDGSVKAILYREKKVIEVTGFNTKFENVDDNIKLLNSISIDKINFGVSTSSYYTNCYYFSKEAPKVVTFGFEDISEPSLKKLCASSNAYNGEFVFDKEQEYTIVDVNTGNCFNSFQVLAQIKKDAKGQAIQEGRHTLIDVDLPYIADYYLNIKVKEDGTLESLRNNVTPSDILRYGYNCLGNNWANFRFVTDNSVKIDSDISMSTLGSFKLKELEHANFKVLKIIFDGNPVNLKF